MFYRYPQKGGVAGLNIGSIEVIALFHTAAAFLLLSFIIVHLYLITTGATVTSNLKAMITGFEELDCNGAEKTHNSKSELTEESKIVIDEVTHE